MPIASLHADHVAADNMRIVNRKYAVQQLLPPSRLPGFMFHQTERTDDNGDNPCFGTGGGRTPGPCYDSNVRDFDFLGYKYSVLSTVGTAGQNNVLAMIPARDEQEMALYRLRTSPLSATGLRSPTRSCRRSATWCLSPRWLRRQSAAPMARPPSPTTARLCLLVQPRHAASQRNPPHRRILGIANVILELVGRGGAVPGRQLGPAHWVPQTGDVVRIGVGGNDARVLRLETAPGASAELALPRPRCARWTRPLFTTPCPLPPRPWRRSSQVGSFE